MAGATFKLTGGVELQEALGQFSKSMGKAVGRRALKKAADPIFEVYQANTTVASGNLVRSETVGTKLNRRQTRMNRKLPSKSAVEVHIGTNDPAGIQEEFGNRNQAPHPSLSVAWASEGGQAAVDRIGDELWTEIDKTAARVAKRRG